MVGEKHGGKKMTKLDDVIREEIRKSQGDLEMFKSFDNNPHGLKDASESGIIDLLRDIMPKSTEGKVLLGGLIVLGLLALSKK